MGVDIAQHRMFVDAQTLADLASIMLHRRLVLTYFGTKDDYDFGRHREHWLDPRFHWYVELCSTDGVEVEYHAIGPTTEGWQEV